VIVTSLLVRWNGGWSEVTRPDAITAYGRKEAYLALGAVQARDEMTTVSTQQLAIFGDPRTEIAADLEHVDDTDTPYVAFGVGDRVTVPDIPGRGPSLERVTSITVAVDENGHVTYAPELRDPLLDERERFVETVTKMANGSLGGDSRVATPAAFVSSTSGVPMAAAAPPSAGGAPGSLTLWCYDSVPVGYDVALTPFLHRISPSMASVLTWSVIVGEAEMLSVQVNAECSLLVTLSGNWGGLAGADQRCGLTLRARDVDGTNLARNVGPYNPEAMGLLTNSGDRFEVGASWVFACTSNSTLDFTAWSSNGHSLESRVSFVLLEAATGPPFPF
jgi:hypothetical protein